METNADNLLLLQRDPQLVVRQSQRRKQEEAGKVDEPAPMNPYPVAHRQSS